jgi:hypothetical protein
MSSRGEAEDGETIQSAIICIQFLSNTRQDFIWAIISEGTRAIGLGGLICASQASMIRRIISVCQSGHRQPLAQTAVRLFGDWVGVADALTHCCEYPIRSTLDAAVNEQDQNKVTYQLDNFLVSARFIDVAIFILIGIAFGAILALP